VPVLTGHFRSTSTRTYGGDRRPPRPTRRVARPHVRTASSRRGQTVARQSVNVARTGAAIAEREDRASDPASAACVSGDRGQAGRRQMHTISRRPLDARDRQLTGPVVSPSTPQGITGRLASDPSVWHMSRQRSGRNPPASCGQGRAVERTALREGPHRETLRAALRRPQTPIPWCSPQVARLGARGPRASRRACVYRAYTRL
jgi:hypothetical protein